MTCKNDSNAIFGDGLCAECYVRAAWKCDLTPDSVEYVVWISREGTSPLIFLGWQSAAEYTRTRKREIEDLEEEVAVTADDIEGMQCYSTEWAKERGVTYRRILARERELLESKRKGMR